MAELVRGRNGRDFLGKICSRTGEGGDGKSALTCFSSGVKTNWLYNALRSAGPCRVHTTHMEQVSRPLLMSKSAMLNVLAGKYMHVARRYTMSDMLLLEPFETQFV